MKIIDNTTTSRAIGCILGQLAGDALGSLVEFQTPQEIRQKYPHGIREIHDGGAWNTIAGQPTDDSEMALALARSIVAEGAYVQDAARRAYEDWLASKPFDIGRTVYNGIRYEPDHQSQANGALMRVSPLGIFGSQFPTEQVGLWAEQDAIITHPNLVCRQINNLFARALSYAIAEGPTPRDVYQAIRKWSDELGIHDSIRDAIAAAEKGTAKELRESARLGPDRVSECHFSIAAFEFLGGRRSEHRLKWWRYGYERSDCRSSARCDSWGVRNSQRMA
ncbi:ADP-ribosylglycohydrolase family protein [Rhizobium beringeri]|uniref:ADP-ribosylglycohydrolase family protein n=1 Tax=Rhizobium beringeri TaxID=3019934 RepID=UPI00398F3C4A